MLESRGDMSLCGVILYNNAWQEIYADEVGTLVFEPGDGCWVLSEVNMPEPLSMDSVAGLIDNIENKVYGDAIGVAYSGNGDIIVFLTEEKAVRRSIVDTHTDIDDPFYYSTDVEYDLDEFVEED